MRINIYEISGTVVVRMPRDYVKDHAIKKSGYVNLREDEHGNLIISPGVVK